MARIDFTDLHVLVTGGSSGIGRAFVRRAFVRLMVDRRARVCVIALPDDDLIDAERELTVRGAVSLVGWPTCAISRR